jgi:hypothetical protein
VRGEAQTQKSPKGMQVNHLRGEAPVKKPGQNIGDSEGWLEIERREGLVTLSREICLRSDTVFMLSGARSARKPKSRARAEIRASVVAGKRGNARGAKGRRKVEA